MARIANLPVKLRNRKGVPGGTQVVGWLPVVRSDHMICFSNVTLIYSRFTQIGNPEEYKEQSNWVDFKHAIWHDSFWKLLESIEHLSVTGHHVNCGDGVTRNIYPIILILVADYEEQ